VKRIAQDKQESGSSLGTIRILDLTRYLPGPFSTLILADMGAEVIKIEMPERQDAKGFSSIGKGFGPSIQLTDDEFSAYSVLNRNKMSITLDFKNEQDREEYYKLVRTADVIVDDFRPGVTEKLGIDYETLKRINPDIIYCAVSGFGQDGPYANLPGFDPNFIALSGFLDVNGDSKGNHTLPGLPVSDLAGGIFGSIGILIAIIDKLQGKGGQFIDISVADVMSYLVGIRLGPLFFSKEIVPKRGRRLSHVYKTKDGKFVCFSFGTLKFWENTCNVLDLNKYVKDWLCVQALGMEDYMENPEELLKKQHKIIKAIERRMAEKDREEWMQLFLKMDVCATPVNTMGEAFSDPQLVHRRMILELDHPRCGKVKQVGIPIKMSKTKGKVRYFTPKKGEHNKEILGNLR